MNFDAVKNRLIDEAKRAGLDEYEIFFSEGNSISTETLKGEISSFASQTDGGIGFRCIYNGQMGIASTQLFTEDEMAELVCRAIENAKNTESTDKAIIYKGSESYAELDLPEIPEADAALLKEKALDLYGKLSAESEYIIDGTQTGAVLTREKTVLINSYGLNLSNDVGILASYVQPVVQKDGESQYGFVIKEALEGEQYDNMVKEATDEALAKIGAVEIESGKYDIIIDSHSMRSILSAFSSVFSGRSANLGLSLLKGKEGEIVASDCVTLVDDPMYVGSLMQTAFDGEGVATYKKNVIEAGVLKTLLYDLASADTAGKESTGNGRRGSYASNVTIAPYHFYIAGGECNEDELLQKLGDGIYITELKGLHAGANAVTGDYSIESFGFRVRDGKKCEAVKSFTVAGNFFELLKSIEAVSSNVKFSAGAGFTNFGAPDVLIRKMSVAGI